MHIFLDNLAIPCYTADCPNPVSQPFIFQHTANSLGLALEQLKTRLEAFTTLHPYLDNPDALKRNLARSNTYLHNPK